MAKGIGEDPRLSPSQIVRQVAFPSTRDDLVQTAGEMEAPATVINFFKCMPKADYDSAEQCMRDFAEAERRFGVGYVDEQPSRENLGRTIIEDTPGVPTHHP